MERDWGEAPKYEVKSMGLFDRLFPPKEQKYREETLFRTLTAYQPRFTTWDGCVYEAALVRASIDAVARNFSKLTVETKGAARPDLRTKLQHAPNDWCTWSQFLYRTATILMIQNTAVIVPVINRYGETTGIYSVLPDRCAITEYKGIPYLRLTFDDQKTAAVELEKCGILTRFQYKSDFFGDSMQALRPTLELIDLQNQAIKESVKNSATYRFMATVGNFTNAADLAEERKRFTEYNLKNNSGNGGFLLFPNTYKDIKQITSQPFVVDAKQQELIEKNVFDYFGVNEAVIQNRANEDERDAFFSGMIEPLANQLGEVMTKMLFSMRERSFGAKIEITSNRISNMSTREKLEFANSMIDRGILVIDEVRELFGMAPLPEGQGKVSPIRGEYHYLQQEVNEDAGEQ